MLFKTLKIVALVVIVFIILISLFLLYNNVYLKYACSMRGGRWESVIQAGNHQCNMPATDAGKPCTRWSQCESGACVKTGTDMGKCYEWKGWECADMFGVDGVQCKN